MSTEPVCDHVWECLPDRIPTDNEPCSRCGKTVPELLKLSALRYRNGTPMEPMPVQRNARAVLCGELPARFAGLVGVYPQAVFRPHFLDTEAIDGVSLFVHGQSVPCDGSRYELIGGTMHLGDALVVDVENQRPEPVHFKCTFRGASLGAPQSEIAHGLKLGAKLVRPQLEEWCEHDAPDRAKGSPA